MISAINSLNPRIKSNWSKNFCCEVVVVWKFSCASCFFPQKTKIPKVCAFKLQYAKFWVKCLEYGWMTRHFSINLPQPRFLLSISGCFSNRNCWESLRATFKIHPVSGSHESWGSSTPDCTLSFFPFAPWCFQMSLIGCEIWALLPVISLECPFEVRFFLGLFGEFRICGPIGLFGVLDSFTLAQINIIEYSTCQETNQKGVSTTKILIVCHFNTYFSWKYRSYSDLMPWQCCDLEIWFKLETTTPRFPPKPPKNHEKSRGFLVGFVP